MDAAQMLARQPVERIEAVFAELPHVLADHIRAYLPDDLRRQVRGPLADVEEDTVGEMMEPALAVLPESATVQDAIDFLRNHETPRMITYLYVTDEADRLAGLVVIRDLILAEPGQALRE